MIFRPALERFHEKYVVALAGYETPCWLWTYCLSKGYARLLIGRSAKLAHKWFWEHQHGPVPQGLELDHLCKNPSCVNDSHLEPVTRAVNAKRGRQGNWLKAKNALVTCCPNGHPYEGSNLRIEATKHGGISRRCKVCRNGSQLARYYARK